MAQVSVFGCMERGRFFGLIAQIQSRPVLLLLDNLTTKMQSRHALLPGSLASNEVLVRD
jgi:hypothetical protein